MDRRLLSTYLNDHLAGAVAAAQLARRCSHSNQDTSYHPVLAQLTREIEEDRQALREIMRRLAVGEDRSKFALAWTAEKLGRLKPNGRLLSYSPLSRLEELEVLTLGVEGKLLMWQTLLETGGDAVADAELEVLIKRARSQRQRLRRLRLQAAAETL